MRLLDFTYPTIEENLACDEVLLEQAESDGNLEVLRFWMPRTYAVVLGLSNVATREVYLDRCAARGIPVRRRCTGGGTVLQGPGCLNYALILRHDQTPRLSTVPDTNRFIMSRHATALSQATGHEITPHGITDLAIDDRKISGNAQRRRRTHLLFHGTFLLGLDTTLMQELLPLPTHTPAYRKARSHPLFVRDLSASADVVKRALRQLWHTAGNPLPLPNKAIRHQVETKYSRPEWNLRR